jgi:hypothetical protein
MLKLKDFSQRISKSFYLFCQTSFEEYAACGGTERKDAEGAALCTPAFSPFN